MGACCTFCTSDAPSPRETHDTRSNVLNGRNEKGRSSVREAEASRQNLEAARVQAIWRGQIGRAVADRRSLWQTWNELDKQEEHDLLRQHEYYNRLVKKYKQAMRQGADPDGFEFEDELYSADFSSFENYVAHRAKRMATIVDKQPLSGFVGPYAIADLPVLDDDSTITLDFVGQLREQCALDRIVSYQNTWQLLQRSAPLLARAPNVVQVPLHAGETMLVVGDLHGQYKDLHKIFDLTGEPCPGRHYLFNGDFVDRGVYSCEVMLLLLSFKLLYPEYVHLNRGNHEALNINATNGFETEVMTKYDRETFMLFSDVFACLPLAHVVQDQLFIVHGGLGFEPHSIADLQKINRFVHSPLKGTLLVDLLWSDPGMLGGAQPNRRGAGACFGQDIVEAFLQKNDLKAIFRSHECEDEGYRVWFDEQLFTIFSASNYMDNVGNKAAVFEVDSDLNISIHQYLQLGQTTNIAKQYELLEVDVLGKLFVRIAKHRTQLEAYWQEVAGGDGRINRPQWSKGLSEVLGIACPFLMLAKRLGLNEGHHSRIDYQQFLRRFKPHHRLSAQGGPLKQALGDLIFRDSSMLGALFRQLDHRKDGQISLLHFAKGIEVLLAISGAVVEISQAELQALGRSIDRDKDGFIDYQDFLHGFVLDFVSKKEIITPTPKPKMMGGMHFSFQTSKMTSLDEINSNRSKAPARRFSLSQSMSLNLDPARFKTPQQHPTHHRPPSASHKLQLERYFNDCNVDETGSLLEVDL